MGFWKKAGTYLKKTWNFVWNGESWLSWVVDIVLAFVLIKFVVYPILGLVLSTSVPIVAVVSGSMEHTSNFDQWWQSQENIYSDLNITKKQFLKFPNENGFNKGDLMILYSPKNSEIGDIAVYNANIRFDPIIHRIVKIENNNGSIIYTTKGDNVNRVQDFEKIIPENNVIGKAVFRIPLLGWIKIGFSCITGGPC